MEDEYILISKTCEYYFLWQKGLCRSDQPNDLEMERVSCFVQVGLSNHKGARGSQSQKEGDVILEAEGAEVM